MIRLYSFLGEVRFPRVDLICTKRLIPRRGVGSAHWACVGILNGQVAGATSSRREVQDWTDKDGAEKHAEAGAEGEEEEESRGRIVRGHTDVR